MKYYALALPEAWACDPSSRWVQQKQRENVLCSICERVLHGWFPSPIDVMYARPIELFHVLETSQAGIALIDIRLLNRISSYLPPVAIGKALDQSGNPVDTHRTIYPEFTVEPRHYPPRKITVCPECGTIRTYPACSKPSYLVSYQLRGRPCVMDKIGMIYISDAAASQIDVSDLKPLFFQEIEVRDRPLDGLRYPDDPPWVQGRDATIPYDPIADA